VSDFNPADHTIDEVKAHLEQHPEDADAVLAAEQARGDEARVTLLNTLERSGAQGDNGEMTWDKTLSAQGQERLGWKPQAPPSQPHRV
jgi:hypothetical protein